MKIPDAGKPADSVEAWCRSYISSTSLQHKCRPGPPPEHWEDPSKEERLPAPGRPPELQLIPRSPRSIRQQELRRPSARARLLHTFWHHELQAAELMCWAILSFPQTPREFRHGLLGIALDEIRHMQLYERELGARGRRLGEYPVRDWFWERAPACQSPLQFVTLLNLGLEGGNLDHCAGFAASFAAVGDHEAAAIQAQIEREEIPHVRFGLHWFETWTAGQDFQRFRQELVAPLSPRMMRGKQLNRRARLEAGFAKAFLDQLETER